MSMSEGKKNQIFSHNIRHVYRMDSPNIVTTIFSFNKTIIRILIFGIFKLYNILCKLCRYIQRSYIQVLGFFCTTRGLFFWHYKFLFFKWEPSIFFYCILFSGYLFWRTWFKIPVNSFLFIKIFVLSNCICNNP